MMAIKASLAGSRADCVRERLRDCGPGAIQRRQPRRGGRLDVKRRLGQGGGRWASSRSNAAAPLTLASFALFAANSGRHAPPRPGPPDEFRFRMAVRPTRSSRGAMAQAFLGLAADPLDAVQQRESRQRSRIAGRRPVEEKKHEYGDAGQQGKPGERHIPHRSLPERRPLLLRACKIALAVLMGTGCDASLVGDETPWVPWRVVAGGKNGSSIVRIGGSPQALAELLLCAVGLRHRRPHEGADCSRDQDQAEEQGGANGDPESVALPEGLGGRGSGDLLLEGCQRRRAALCLLFCGHAWIIHWSGGGVRSSARKRT